MFLCSQGPLDEEASGNPLVPLGVGVQGWIFKVLGCLFPFFLHLWSLHSSLGILLEDKQRDSNSKILLIERAY